jgi:hypothetical protein
MSNVPEGATLSEDGYYWWDGSEWQPVDPPPGSEGSGDGGGGDAASCVIAFVDVYAGNQSTGMGPLVIVDTEDNPDDHYVLHVDAGCVAVWGEGNFGNGDCTYVDTWVLDGGSSQDTEDLSLAPGTSTTRSVSLGRLSAGSHKFEVWLNNGAYGSNEFTVED